MLNIPFVSDRSQRIAHEPNLQTGIAAKIGPRCVDIEPSVDLTLQIAINLRYFLDLVLVPCNIWIFFQNSRNHAIVNIQSMPKKEVSHKNFVPIHPLSLLEPIIQFFEFFPKFFEVLDLLSFEQVSITIAEV